MKKTQGLAHIHEKLVRVTAMIHNYTKIANSSQVNEEQKQACLDLVEQLARLAACYDACGAEYEENGRSEDFMRLFKQAAEQHSEVVDAQLDVFGAVTE